MVMKSDFRRSVAADTKKKGGGGGKSFYERFRFPKDIVTPALILKGEYVDQFPAPEQVVQDPRTGQNLPVVNPYFKFRKHVRKMFKNGREMYQDEICSAGNDPHNPQPCAGCFAVDTGDKSINVSDNYAFGILHLVPYHTHPLLDKTTGQVVMKKDNSGAVIVDDECVGERLCNYCRILRGQPLALQQGETFPNWRPQDIGNIFGKRRYLELGKSHLGDLFGWDEIIGKQCGTCRQVLIVDGFSCAFCNTKLIDMQNDPRTDAEIKEAISRPIACMHCQRGVPVNEIVACENCERSQRKFSQLSLFDVVVYGMRQGESTKSHLVLGLGPSGVPYNTLEEFGQSVHPNWFGGKTFMDFVKEKGVPYDFADILKPRSLQDQAKHLEISMPGATAPAGQGYSPYAGAPTTGGYPAPVGYQPSGPVPAPYGQPPAAPGPAPFNPGPQPNWSK